MKQLYTFLILLLFINAYASGDGSFAPTATMSGNASVCIGSAQPLITFTGVGVAPFTFVYTLNGSPQTVISAGNSTTVPQPTSLSGNFVYHLVSVAENGGPATTVSVPNITIVVNPKPVVSFSSNANATTCSGTVVQFTSTVTTGIAPFTYEWDFGGDGTSTQANPSHSFTALGCATKSFTVTLKVTDTNGCESVVVSNNVMVKEKPDINFTDTLNPFGDPFNNCSVASASSPVYSITVGNATTSACITSYDINWGDGNSETNVSFPKSHTYNLLGAYNMVITAHGTNGCSNSKTYVIKNVSNPSGGITSPGSTTNLCSPTANLQFSISNWGANSPSTTYAINYGDNSPIVTLTQEQMVASTHYNPSNPGASANYPIPHSYTSSSCPQTQITAVLTVTNACGSTTGTISNISILSKPIANFTNPPQACINTSVTFTNTTDLGYNQNCNRNFIYAWDFGDGSPIVTTTPIALQNISHVYTSSGNYTITLTVTGFCGSSSIAKQICVESPLTPQFTLNSTTGCTGLTVLATNTTSTVSSCTAPTYNWAVSYVTGNCGTASGFTFANGTSASSANPAFVFNSAGVYSIRLTTTNACGNVTSTAQTITVKQPPTVNINPIANLCGSGTITPTATVSSCAPTGETLSYAWSFPGGTPATASSANPGNISYATTGTHTVSLIVTNSCGSSTTATQNFNVSAAPTVSNSVLSQTVCSGLMTVPILLTSNPNTATFNWTATATGGVTGFIASGNSSTIPAQMLIAGSGVGTVTYQIIPSLNSCPGAPVNYVITVNPAPIITSHPADATICQGGTLMPLTVNISGSSGTPTYQWYSNTTASTTSGTAISGATNAAYTPAGTVGVIYYYCIISLPASAGCASITTNPAKITVTAGATITTQPTPTQTICVGASATSLSIAYSGGTGLASYQWYTNTTSSNSGGTLISGATNVSYIPGAYTTPGTNYYYVVVTLSGTGCGSISSAVAEVVVVADPIISTQPLITQTLCQGVAPTALTVTAAGNSVAGVLSYQWYSNTINSNTGGVLLSGQTATAFNPPTTATGTIYYYCIVSQTATDCSMRSQTSEVIVITAPTITNQPVSSTVCVGGAATLLSVTAGSGVGTPTYQWYSSTSSMQNGTAITGEISNTFAPPATTIGTIWYYCIVTYPGSGGCSAIPSQSVFVTVSAGAVISTQPQSTQDLCVGSAIAVPLSAAYTGGTGTPTWQWFQNTTNSNAVGTMIPGAISDTYTPPVFTTTGTYYYYTLLTLSGANCGSVTSNVATINVLADPTVTSQPLPTQSLCQNAVPVPLSVLATGGIGTFSYQWFSNTVSSTSGGTIITSATTDTLIPPTTAAGTTYYYCEITQTGTGCNTLSAAAQVTVTISPSITAQPQSSTICLGQTPTLLSVAYINGVGTPQFQWYSNTSNSNVGGIVLTGETNASFAPSATVVGTRWYYCIITLSSGGCSSLTSDVAEVTINQTPVVSSTMAIICSGNAFTISPSTTGADIVPSGTTYTWNNPVVSPAGAITGASIQNLPQSNISQTLVNSTLSPATVTYTVTPLSGSCVGAAFTVAVTVNPSVSSNAVVSNSTCFGINNAFIQTNISGGIPFTSGSAYQVVWSGPNGFTSNLPSIAGIAPGQYNLAITDAGGCPVSENYTVTEPADIIITTNLKQDVSCFGAANGMIDLSVSGGTGNISFAWTRNTSAFATTEDISNLTPGIYEVAVSDANNCGPKIQSFTIAEPAVLDANLVNKTDVICYGAATGSITINVSGGTPTQVSPGVFDYNYAWSGPNGFTASTQNLANITAGNYTVTITDQNLCAEMLSVTINQSPEIIINATTTAIECYGDNNASISITITGGNQPYQIAWSNLGTGLFQDNLSAGIYTITVTDATNCIRSLAVNIPEAPIFAITPVVKNVTCFGKNDGSITLNLVGGIAPISLVWSDNGNTGVQRNNLGPGTYTVTIIDSKPCNITRAFTILEPQELVLSGNVIHAFDCSNANSGSINLLVSGGSAPFTYTWSNGALTEDLLNISAGNYQVTVTDSNGCSKNLQFSVNRQPPLVANVKTETDFDCDTKYVKQTFIGDVTGGVPPYNLSWSSGTVSGANNQFMETNTNGTVILSVTDALSCSTNYTFNVDIPELGTPSFTAQSFAYSTFGVYSIVDPIQFTNTATGDFISVAWDFGDGSVSTELNPTHSYLREADYVVTLTVTYPFGCIYRHVMTLQVDKGYELIMPTAFTPNNDSINDNFSPVFKGLKSVRIDVYSTWGEMIYSEEGTTLKGWEGNIKGLSAENGNYYYRVTAETFYGTVIKQDGPFVLIK